MSEQTHSIGYMNNLKVIQQLSSSNLEQLIVLDFYAKWCAPCKQLTPILEELANEYTDVIFYKIDIEDELAFDLVQTFKISKLPTLVYYRGNKEVARTNGINIEIIRAAILTNRVLHV